MDASVVERGKIQMQYIENKRSRRVTFATRRNGLKKKLHELTTLCDVEACFVCYGTDGELETWPEDRPRLAQILDRYTTMEKKHRDKNKIEVIPSRSTTSLLLDQQPSKKKKLLQEEISGVDDLSNERLAELRNLVESKLQQVKRRIQFLINSNQTTTAGSPVSPSASPLNYYWGNPNPNPMMQQPPPMMPPTSTFGFPPEMMMMMMMQSGINYIPVTYDYLGTTYHGFMPVAAPLHSNPPHSS